MPEPGLTTWIVLGILSIWLILIAVLLISYKKPLQGQVLIRNGMGGWRISFSGMIVLPLIQNGQFVDITLKRLVIERCGRDALTCKDGTRIDVKAAFFVRINPAAEDILDIVQTLGAEAVSNIKTLNELFGVRFQEVLQKAAKGFTFEEACDREEFKNKVITAVGKDLDGYVLDVVAIDYLAKSEE